MLAYPRLAAAYEKAKAELLAERTGVGHWVGELSTSALSTATAVSALAVVRRAGLNRPHRADLDALIAGGTRWLTEHQNSDGGFGDTDLSYSNIATTLLVVAALHLAGVTAAYTDLLHRAERYINAQGRLAGLRARYGVDKTFVVPIMTNLALAGRVGWSEVSPLPFELACVPQSWYRFMQMPVVSYAIPALVAVGQARYFHLRPWNPLLRWLRGAAVEPALRVLRNMQPASGGYLEAVPLTSFVVMSLASTGRAEQEVTRAAVKFLADSVRPDGSWPIDTNLATWVTTLSLNALASGGEDLPALLGPRCLDWLLSCQHLQRHPFTGAEPGGWGWSDLSGAVPDADDTPGALLALDAWRRSPSCTVEQHQRIVAAARHGFSWLFKLQNRDGGMPTFCRGWGKLPFDRSGTDLTAHFLRALAAWKEDFFAGAGSSFPGHQGASLRAGNYLFSSRQAPSGAWSPLWFGNQEAPDEVNTCYGTAKVALLGADQPDRKDCIIKGLQFLTKTQNVDGGWGNAGVSRGEHPAQTTSSVEETALAVEALLGGHQGEFCQAAQKGLLWLVECVEGGRNRTPAPIGFYFAKLWYYEKLYPLTFTVSALGRAVRVLAST